MMHERARDGVLRRMGQPASRESFCRLYINNEFQGLYAIVESVDNDYLDREHRRDTPATCIRTRSRNRFTASTWARSSSRTSSASRRRTTRRKATRSSTCRFTTVHEVNEPDDAMWRERVEQYVDLPQFITQTAIEAFLAENDGLLGAKRHEQLLSLSPPRTRRGTASFPGTRTIRFSSPTIRSSSVPTRTSSSAVRSPTPICASCIPGARVGGAFRRRGWLARKQVEKAGGADCVAPLKQDTRKPFSTEAFSSLWRSLKQFARLRSKLVLEQVEEARKRR